MTRHVARGTALLAIFLPYAVVSAQSPLPAPSRTIYKCVVKGAVSYSDEPCAGAQRLDATPTSGVTHLSGSTRTGKDVAGELHREQFAAAFRPLTGMNAPQLDAYSRRNRLDISAQRECNRIEPAILGLEQSEGRADAVALKPIQQDLLTLRKRYKTLAC
jgi:hypothetical protein